VSDGDQNSKAVEEPALVDARSLVEVWLADVAQCNDGDFGSYLNSEEAAQAATYPEIRRRQFTIARAIVRRVLSQVLGQPPQCLPLRCDRKGKLYVAGGPAFSISHSGTLVAVTVTDAAAVGIDVERVRTDVAVMTLAKRSLSATQAAAVSALPAKHHLLGFFSAWTEMEAIAKAVGEGLALGPKAFVLTRDGDRNLVNWRTTTNHPRLEVASLPCPRGYVGAVAATGRHWRLRVHDFAMQASIPQFAPVGLAVCSSRPL
jgi:4'-phosphopantetheinyl transferase